MNNVDSENGYMAYRLERDDQRHDYPQTVSAHGACYRDYRCRTL